MLIIALMFGNAIGHVGSLFGDFEVVFGGWGGRLGFLGSRLVGMSIGFD